MIARKLLALCVFSISLIGVSFVAKAGTWFENQPMDSARAKLSAAEVHGDIFVAGGAGISGPRSSFDLYDPASDMWRPLPPMPVGREQFGMAASNGVVYVSGGLAGNDRHAIVSKDLWAYDPLRTLWIKKALMPFARRGHTMVTVGSKLYVIGGEGQSSGKVQVYNTITNEWSVSVASFASPRANLAAAAVGDTIYVLGGAKSDGTQSSRVDRLNVKDGSWTRVADLPSGRSGLIAAELDGVLHVAGGATPLPSQTFSDHLSYDANSNSWKSEAKLLTPRHSMASVTVDGRWYLIGGGSGSGFFTLFTIADAVEVFDPAR